MTAMPPFGFEPKASKIEIQVVVNHKQIGWISSGFSKQLQSRRPASVHIGLRLCQNQPFVVPISILGRAESGENPRGRFPKRNSQKLRISVQDHKTDVVTAARVVCPGVPKPYKDLQY